MYSWYLQFSHNPESAKSQFQILLSDFHDLIAHFDCTIINKVWLGPPKTSKMESFATIVNGLKPLTAVAKLSTLDVCEDCGYDSAWKCFVS